MEYTISLKSYKTPTDTDYNTTISGGYLDIKGRVYDITKDSPAKSANGIEDANGYWKANGELTGLINPFTNPVTNTAVAESKIEVSFTDIRGWGQMLSEKNYFDYIASGTCEKIEKRYFDLFGVKIKLRYTLVPEEKKEETKPISGSVSETDSATKKTEEVPATGQSASEANAAGLSASNINGEFTFNIEQENAFIGVNNQLGTLILVGIGEIKDEPLEKPAEEVLEEEVLDEEYEEEEYKGAEEVDPEISAIPLPSALDMMEQADANRDTSESDAAYKSSGQVITGKLNTTVDKGKGFGIISKTTGDKDLLKIMVDYIEGGYYYPGHAYSKFSEKDRKLYGSSGETLWGIDRHAGQTEKSELGKRFWAAIDAISGYGDSTGKNGYSRKTNTRSWDSGTYKTKGDAWRYGYSPTKKDKGYDVMYAAFVEYATKHLEEWLNTYFKSHPVKALILSDSRLKFMWLRATWNGPGWFSWYANGKKGGKAPTGIKWAYDNVSKNVEDLIIWDLNNRLLFGNSLITHDVKKIAKLIGVKG